MDDFWTRFVEDLTNRVTGPMRFRLVVQPIIASMLAILAGLRDARLGKPPYFWSLFSDPTDRIQRLAGGWKDVGRVFILAVVLDLVYKVIVSSFMFPGETLVVAVVLAIVPYLIVRGAVTRLTRRK